MWRNCNLPNTGEQNVLIVSAHAEIDEHDIAAAMRLINGIILIFSCSRSHYITFLNHDSRLNCEFCMILSFMRHTVSC